MMAAFNNSMLLTGSMSSRKTVSLPSSLGENNTLRGVVERIGKDMAVVKIDGGEVVDAVPVNVSNAGERTQVSVRPERVELDQDRLPDGAHTISAEVLGFIYMGDTFRIRLKGSGVMTISSSNAGTLPGRGRLTPGETVNIGWLPEDCRALDCASQENGRTPA